MKHTQLTQRNNEILENYFKEMQKILYCKASPHAKRKMLYGAKYWAEYFMSLNNSLIKKALQEALM